MAIKLASAIITLVLLTAIAVVVFASMLIIMNGFSERDATWGIAAFGLLVAGTVIIAAVTAGWLATLFEKRQMHAALAVFLSSLISTVAGGVLIGVSGFLGIVVADIVRKNH